MGLWPLNTVAPCMSYPDGGSCTPGLEPPLWVEPNWLGYYNPQLMKCPRHYQHATDWLSNFFYEPGNDRVIAHIVLKTTYWPGWDVCRYEFDAATGQWLNQDDVFTRGSSAHIGIWGPAYTQKATIGSFNKLYACRNDNTKINEIMWESAVPATNGWWVDPHTWDPPSIYLFAIVNRNDNLVAAASDFVLDCWRNINTTPERFGQLKLPGIISYLAYESRKNCWLITTDGVILKADYQIPRWEMISTVQDPTSDTVRYFITFDTKRNRVILFRQRPDTADGACQNQLEFYYPMVKPAQLTQPVPVTSLRGGNRITLVANLIGDAGEGLTPYTVNGSLVAPIEGKLTTPFSNTELNGRVSFQYKAPDLNCTETLQLTVNVEES